MDYSTLYNICHVMQQILDRVGKFVTLKSCDNTAVMFFYFISKFTLEKYSTTDLTK